MKKLRIISLLLSVIMILSALVACDTPEETTSAESNPTEMTETHTEKDSESNVRESETEETETETETKKGESEIQTEADTEITLEGKHATLIENANSLANGVNAYFPDAGRESVVISNMNMSFDYALKHYDDQLVNSIKNTKGVSYVENTMDVFVKMKNGKTFYASKSEARTLPNLYRMGYYMYELRLEGQTFVTDIAATDYYEIDLKRTNANGIKRTIQDDGSFFGTISNTQDPYISFSNVKYSADTYNYLQLVMKADVAEERSAYVYVAAGEYSQLGSQYKIFYLIPDGEYHTYNIPLSSIKGYEGDVTQFRLDINGQKGESFTIKDIKIINAGDTTAPRLSLNRSIFAYSDKLHERLQIVAHEEVNDIEEIGMITKISADTVDKLIVKDANGDHTSIESVDWASAEYIGFDIKEAGIFGYILPNDPTSGQITVTLEDGYYVLIQSRVPENNTIISSVLGTLNANDFYMGQRFYTDENHDFDAFLEAAYCERNPLSEKLFSVSEAESDEGAFAGYDALRGAYVFTLKGTGFNPAYYSSPNRHYKLKFTVRGDKHDRSIYTLVYSNTGSLECAVLLDDDGMMLPIPLEVGKNFKGDGEDNIYNLDDKAFSDVVFPLVIKSGEKLSYTVVDLYQNWGNFPLKQLSWIQFHAPYYHLSTGVTETNCIVPWYTTRGGRSIGAFLPDHRAMSAPLWPTQPQHTSGGDHALLSYTDADGNYSATELKKNTIDSYGPTYADIVMEYMSDDGKIKAKYTHMEMPQTDENRGYYEMKLEVLEDVSFKNFRNDFAFYTVTDNNGTGSYTQFGYLNENNESTVVAVNESNTPVFYVLGDNCPYFDYFNMKEYYSNENGYVNLSFLIYNSEIIIGGEKLDANFSVKEQDLHASLSLDLGEVTLKAGDTITINAIIMPWGSQESVYDSEEFAPDRNVREVRENTLLDPLTVRADADCEVIDSPFIPKLRTTNGKSAEFTLSGGENNAAVRIYGFNKLTSPKVYELKDGEWTEYKLSSASNPDPFGYYHYYDGYCVYYDRNGTYSYSFVADMNGDATRTFRIVVEDDFKPWPEEIKIEVPDPIDLYLSPEDLQLSAVSAPIMFSKSELGSDDGIDFVRIYGNNRADSYFNVYKKGEAVTGQYFVMKYRIPEGNPELVDYFELYTSTVNEGASNGDGYSIKKAVIPDGNWHVLIVDLAARGKQSFVPTDDGKYIVKYLRLDVFNAKASSETRFDFAYAGLCDNIEEVFDMEPSMQSVMLSVGENVCYYIDKNGKQVGEEIVITPASPTVPEEFDIYLDPNSILERSNKTGTHVGKREVKEDGDSSYISLFSKEGGAAEAYFFIFSTAEPTAAGRYAIVKYRSNDIRNFEFWSSTSPVYTTGDKTGQPKKNVSAPESNDVKVIWAAEGFKQDGEWQVLVVDLAAMLKNYKAADDGKYYPYFLRLDLFGKTEADVIQQVDIEYFGIGTDLEKLVKYEKKLSSVTFYNGTEVKTLSTETAEEIKE